MHGPYINVICIKISSPIADDCHKLDFCLEYDAYPLSN